MARLTHKRMVEELVVDGVLKTLAIIEAFRAVDRADFVPPVLQEEEYLNVPLPIGFGQTISQPYTVAFMLELLAPQIGETILDVGSGSGWQTSLLAYIVSQEMKLADLAGGGHVTALEIIPELCEVGLKNVAKYDFIEKGIVEMHCMSGLDGYPEAAPFDKIVAAAAGETVPEAWQEQLKVGGRIVTPIGSSILLLEKIGEDKWKRTEYPGFRFVPMVGD